MGLKPWYYEAHMLVQQKRIIFYIIFYVMIAFTLCLSLSLNIKSAKINSQLQEHIKKLAILEEENRGLYYTVSMRIGLSNIDTLSTETLHMAAPKKIY